MMVAFFCVSRHIFPTDHVCTCTCMVPQPCMSMLLCKSSRQQFGTQLFSRNLPMYPYRHISYIDRSRQVADTCLYTIRNLWLFCCHGASVQNFSFESVGLPRGLRVSPALSCVCCNELATWLLCRVLNLNPELAAMNLEVHIGCCGRLQVEQSP